MAPAKSVTMVIRGFHEGRWCQYLTAHPASFGEVFVHRVCHHGMRSAWRLDLPYTLTPLSTIKHMCCPWEGLPRFPTLSRK